MFKTYDLHSHSTASDGTLTPDQLLAHAAKQGVDVLALTDHDTVAGLPEAHRAAQKYGVKLINGIELSLTWNKLTLHVVALGFDPEYAPLCAGLQKIQEFRQWRGEEIARRLEKKANIPGALAGATELAKGGVLSRTHFAHFLLKNGHVKGMQDAFDRYLKRGRAGFVPSEWTDFTQGLQWIHEAGGQAVLAHPARYDMTASKLRRVLTDFKECGGVAMEVVSGSHSRNDVFVMADLAKRFELLSSVGSDYHGPENRWVELGRLADLPDGCTPIWHDW